MREVDRFWIDLTLNHESRESEEITSNLGLEPFAAMKAGDRIGSLVRNTSVWMTHIREGKGEHDFARALEDLLSFIADHRDYFADFKLSGGEIELTINQVVGLQDGVLFNLKLGSEVLQACGRAGISLRVQAWSVET